MVRITTWNVNGIRNPFGYKPWSNNRTFSAMFDILEADIVIMQELKIQRKDLTDDMVLIPGWDCYFSLPKHKKGYSGVGIFTRQSVCAPIHAEEGILGILCPPGSTTPYRELPGAESIGGYPNLSQLADIGVDPAVLDGEGRCVVIEFPAFVLFGVYSPANSNGLRDDFRLGFLIALDTRIRNLTNMGKNVILTGDLNVSRDLIDTAKAEDNMKAEGMTHDEYLSTPNRRIFNQLLCHGNVPGQRDIGREEPVLYDLCREFHPDREGMYTHWEQKINARPGNFGSRIDFILCSMKIKDWFKEANIQEGLMGSDHCPVYAVTHDRVSLHCEARLEKDEAKIGDEAHILDLMNPSDMFKNGVRLRDYNASTDVPAFSGRLLPEFNKRRNIRDMFTRRTVSAKLVASNNSMSQSPGSGIDSHPTSALHASDRGIATLGATSTSIAPSAVAGQAISAASPVKSPEKRRAPYTPPIKSVKRSKFSSSTGGTPMPTLGKGQQSLKGFFKSRNKPADADSMEDLGTSTPAFTSRADTAETNGGSPAADYLSASSSTWVQTDPLASQEASREGWTKLFSKKPPPRCESHAEPCISLTTKKPGVNCGRQFWICPRPIGPSGQKEVGTQWRCGTFIWASDWKG